MNASDPSEMPEHPPEQAAEHPTTAGERAWGRATWAVGFMLLLVVIISIWQIIVIVRQTQERTISELLGHFETAGLPVGEPIPLPLDPELKANIQAAVNVPVADGQVQIYRVYDKMLSDQRHLDSREVTRMLKLPTGTEPALNGPFIMTGYETHPQRAKVLESFRGFGTP